MQRLYLTCFLPFKSLVKISHSASKSPEFNFQFPLFSAVSFRDRQIFPPVFPTPNTRRTTKRIQQSPIRTFFRRLFLLRLLRVLDLAPSTGISSSPCASPASVYRSVSHITNLFYCLYCQNRRFSVRCSHHLL